MPCDLPADIFQYLKNLRKTRSSHTGKGAEQELVETSCGMETFSATVLVRLSQRASVVINQEAKLISTKT